MQGNSHKPYLMDCLATSRKKASYFVSQARPMGTTSFPNARSCTSLSEIWRVRTGLKGKMPAFPNRQMHLSCCLV